MTEVLNRAHSTRSLVLLNAPYLLEVLCMFSGVIAAGMPGIASRFVARTAN